MKNLKMPPAHDMHPNVTPLIDIVMCLIIFYMLVAKIGVATGAMKEMDLPVSSQGLKLQTLAGTITLNVLPSAMGTDPQVTTLDEGTGQIIDVKLIDGTKQPLLQLLNRLKGTSTEFKVIIRADKNLDYRFLEPVLIACAEAKVKSVNFTTRTEQSVTSAP